MEEVKSQLGEQLPGSLEAIRKAVSKFYKKDISTSEMFDLMKNGKLLAKDILPLLGEEFSKMARTGGALRVALTSLSTVQQRMNTSFREMINNVYKGGLAEGLSELYRTLDDMFFLMSQGDSNIGKFLKGFIDAAKESIIWTHDTLLDIYYLITEKLGVSGVNAEFLGKVAYWIAIAGAMNTISKAMKIIFGGPMVTMIAKVSTGLSGLVALPFAIIAALNELYDRLGWLQDPKAMAQQADTIKRLSQQASIGGMPVFAQPYFQQQLQQTMQQQSGQVTLKLEMNENLKEIVNTHVENNNQKMIQTILPMGWTPTSN